MLKTVLHYVMFLDLHLHGDEKFFMFLFLNTTYFMVLCVSEELHSHPSSKEWTHPLCVLLAAQCTLQMSTILSCR